MANILSAINRLIRGTASEADLNRLVGALKRRGYTVQAPARAMEMLLQNAPATGRKGLPGWRGRQAPQFSPAETNPPAIGRKALPGWKDRQATAPEKEELPPQFEMLHVSSSNVWAIGYMAWSKELYIRFKSKTGGAGSLYRYFDFPEKLFRDFVEASSKGRFVWDFIRQRGSVSGTKFAFELAGIVGGYVPRAAALKRGVPGEFFVPRTFKEGQIRGGRLQLIPIKSQLPEERVSLRGPNPSRGPGPSRLIFQPNRQGGNGGRQGGRS